MSKSTVSTKGSFLGELQLTKPKNDVQASKKAKFNQIVSDVRDKSKPNKFGVNVQSQMEMESDEVSL